MKTINKETKKKAIFLIDNNEKATKIVRDLSKHLGFPEVQQVLTLYFKTDIRLRCNINNLYVGRKITSKSKVSWKEFSLSSQFLGPVLSVLTAAGLKTASISNTLRMIFPVNKKVKVEYLCNTLISKHQFETYLPLENKHYPKVIKQLLSKTTNEKKITNKIDKISEELVLNDLGVPNEKIVKFCKQTNLGWNQTPKTSYYHRMSAVSNDYSDISKAFSIITGTKVTNTTPTPQIYLQNMPSVSIIIPAYNTGESILKTLGSINRQVPKDIKFEVIVVDDGSSTPIKEILEKSKLKLSFEPFIVRQERNGGSAQTRNIGASIAKNEILIFLDSDIVLTPNYIYEHLLRHKLIKKAVCVSFKENTDPNDRRISMPAIKRGVSPSNYQDDLRFIKYQDTTSMGYYPNNYLSRGDMFSILTETNYFKNLGYGRKIGVFDLSSMVVSHNFSIPKKYFHAIGGFDAKLKGYGLEDAHLGIKAISSGAFILPILSCSVYHIKHPVRRGSMDILRKEFEINSKKISEFLSSNE